MKTTEKISLKLTNNTPIKQSVSILGGQQSSFENANNNVLVQWDISGETFATNEVTLKLPTPITKLYTGSNIKGVVESLNTMGVATFSYEGTIIYATNLLDEDVQTSNLCVGDEFTFFIGSGFNNTTFAFEIDAARGVLVGGDFTTYNGNVSNYIVRLLEDGTYDAAFSIGTGFNGRVLVISKQTDGKILVGGEFTDYNGTAANRIIRLNSDGSIDGTFVYGTGFNGSVSSVILQALTENTILVGGSFNTYNGVIVQKIVRLLNNGSIDATFPTSNAFDNDIQLLKLHFSGKILVSGSFANYKGVNYNRIIRLNTDASSDTTTA